MIMSQIYEIFEDTLQYRGSNHRERRIKQAEKLKKQMKQKKPEKLKAKAAAPAFDSTHSKSEWLNGLRMKIDKSKRNNKPHA